MEGLSIARAVRHNLSHDARVTVWTESTFALSESTLNSLCQELPEHDFGVFVLRADDFARMRENIYSVTRDNVIFELGLFVGYLGKNRVFLIVPEDREDQEKFHLPSDLIGVQPARFEPDWAEKEPNRALGLACDQIRPHIVKLGTLKEQAQAERQRFQIINKHSGKCLDIWPDQQQRGQKAVQCDYNAQPSQTWFLEQAEDGWHRIVSKLSDKCLDVYNHNPEDGAEVVQWVRSGEHNQLWKLERQQDGSYAIIAKHSGKCLDVLAHGESDGADVVQWKYLGSNNQKWWLQPVL